MTGGAGLVDAERKALVRMSERIALESQREYDDTVKFYTGLAEESNLDPEKVIKKESRIKPFFISPSEISSGEPTREVDGVKFKVRNK